MAEDVKETSSRRGIKTLQRGVPHRRRHTKMYFKKTQVIKYIVVDLHAEKSYTVTDTGGVAKLMGVNLVKMHTLFRKYGHFIRTNKFIISTDPQHIKSNRGGIENVKSGS